MTDVKKQLRWKWPWLMLTLPALLWSGQKNKAPIVAFFTAYCYEASMERDETIFPTLPAETSMQTLQNMAEASDNYTRQLKNIYGFERFQLLSTFGGSIALNLKGVSHKCRIESKSSDQRVVLTVSILPQKSSTAPLFNIMGELNFNNREPRTPVKAELVTAIISGKPICIGGKLPSTQERRAFYIILIPHYTVIDSQPSYNESIAAYRQTLHMTPGSDDLGGGRLIPALNQWLAEHHPEVTTVNFSALLPPQPPPPPILINDDGHQVHQYEYDTVPTPVDGWAAFKKKLDYPPKAQKEGIEGMVVVYTQIDHLGAVKGIRVTKSIPLLDEAAIKAIRSTRWKPALKEGKPLTVWVNIPVFFNLK